MSNRCRGCSFLRVRSNSVIASVIFPVDNKYSLMFDRVSSLLMVSLGNYILKSAMKTHRAIRYRLHPGSRTKARRLRGTTEACRFTWNHFVGKLRDDYKWCGRCDPRWYSNGKLFAVWSKHQAPWLQDYSFAIVRLSLKSIETAYRQFWKGEGELPRFKPHYDHVPSFPLGAGMFKLQGKSLHIARVGQVKLSGRNPYPGGTPNSGAVKLEPTGRYAYIVHEAESTQSRYRSVLGDVPDEQCRFEGALEWIRGLSY